MPAKTTRFESESMTSILARPRLDGLTDLPLYLVLATLIYSVLNIIGGSRDPAWSNLVWGAGIFAIALAISAALHYWVEAPAERHIPQWQNSRDLAVATQ